MHAQPIETEPELCLSVSCRGTGQQWPATGALGAADLGMASAFLKEEVAINPTTKPPELTQDWETDSWRALTKACVHQDPDPDLPMSVQ